MSDSGRFYVKVEGRTFCIEPIDSTMGKSRKMWGDIDPATKTVSGNYGNKHIGSINEDESIITKENGFTNIQSISPGESPISYIEQLVKKCQ